MSKRLKHKAKILVRKVQGQQQPEIECDPFIEPWIRLVEAEPADSDWMDMDKTITTAERVGKIAEKTELKGQALLQESAEHEGLLAWRRELDHAVGKRRLFRTDTGLLGLGPIDMEVGDGVWILAGGGTPFVLRGASRDATYQLLGEAYVHGIMHGEAVEGLTVDHLEEILLV